MQPADEVASSDGAIEVHLLRSSPALVRLDVAPWLAVHAVLLWLWLSGRSEGPYSFLHALCVFFAVLGHILTALAQHWSVHAWRRIAFQKSASIGEATHVYVLPVGQATPGSSGPAAAIVPLERLQPPAAAAASPTSPTSSAGPLVSLPPYRFYWRSLAFELRREGAASPTATVAGPGQWLATSVSTALPTALPLNSYGAWAGGGKGWRGSDAETLSHRFGTNVVPVPLPSFAALMLEHAVAPFFVFQIACVGLWCLDEYVWYSLFTLGTLVAMEATLVGQRIATAKQLRGMRPPPHPVWCLRDGNWLSVPSPDLVPMDIISLAREPATGKGAKQGQGQGQAEAHSSAAPCPADVLLLQGSAVVNEAMLTGESTPQVKEAAAEAVQGLQQHGQGKGASSSMGKDGQALLDALVDGSDRIHGRHVVYSGTSIVAATGTGGEGEGQGLPATPDGGALAVVLRTGPYTSQGELLRTIVHATSRVSVADKEAFLFIAGMLVFAIAAAWYVLTQGLADPRRDRWKLGLHVIMILTTVVPPELPVELSMAVNMSLTGLIRKGIYCTEPNRIPLAGKVDTVAFDKTGTLTSDSFRVQGVALLDKGGRTVVVSQAEAFPPATRLVLLGCHDLRSVQVPTPQPKPKAGLGQAAPAPAAAPQYRIEVAGDPIEQAALDALGWAVDKDGVARPKPGAGSTEGGQGLGLWEAALGRAPTSSIRVLHRWPFSSALKRMTAAVVVQGQALGLLQGKGQGQGKDATASSLRLPDLSPSTPVLVTKGAPEVMERLLAPSSLPPGYALAHSRLAGSGARVLALGFRVLPPGTTPSDVSRLSRETVEAPGSLTFAGFLSVSSPVKTDSARTVKELQDSGHAVVMITGDAPLTALAVAGQLGMTGQGQGSSKGSGGGSGSTGLVLDTGPEGALVLTRTGGAGAEEADPSVPAPSLSAVLEASLTCRLLAVTGRGMEAVRRGWGDDALSALCLHATVFARVSPSQKEAIIGMMNAAGRTTAMVGDGSNDTGALKRSHLGLAVLSNPELEERYDRARIEQAAKRREARAAAGAGARPVTGRPAPGAAAAGLPVDEEEDEGEVEALLKSEADRTAAMLGNYGQEEGEEGGAGQTMASRLLDQAMAGQVAQDDKKRGELAALKAKLQAMEAEAAADGAMGGPPVVSLGDASMAAPLTSKLPTPAAILEVLRQGRCTLVTTHQMFKILGVNALVAAYMMSVLHLADVKLGDQQATVTAMGAAACFFLISWAKPIKRLSLERPHNSVFHPGLVLSVLGQFAVHTAALLAASALVGHNPWVVAPPAPEDMVDGGANATAGGAAGLATSLGLGEAVPDVPLAGSIEPDLLAAKLAAVVEGPPEGAATEDGGWFSDPTGVSSLLTSKFKPSHVNTAVFLVYAAAQACTFLVSYHGPPFMEPLSKQTSLWRACGLMYAACLVGAMGWSPDLNSWFQLLPLESSSQRTNLAALIVADGLACAAVELAARWVDRAWAGTGRRTGRDSRQVG